MQLNVSASLLRGRMHQSLPAGWQWKAVWSPAPSVPKILNPQFLLMYVYEEKKCRWIWTASAKSMENNAVWTSDHRPLEPNNAVKEYVGVTLTAFRLHPYTDEIFRRQREGYHVTACQGGNKDAFWGTTRMMWWAEGARSTRWEGFTASIYLILFAWCHGACRGEK